MSTAQKGNPIRRLLSSSKALVVLAISATSFAALWTGKATWQDVEGLLKWTVGPWLAAVGLEDAAKHVSANLRPASPPPSAVSDPSGPPQADAPL